MGNLLSLLWRVGIVSLIHYKLIRKGSHRMNPVSKGNRRCITLALQPVMALRKSLCGNVLS